MKTFETSSGLLEHALHCDAIARSMHPADPACRVYSRDADWFLAEAAKLENQGR